MKTLTYTTKTGTKIEITATAKHMLDQSGNRKVGGRMDVVLTAKVNGADHRAIAGLETFTAPMQGCVARLGQIGFDADRLAMVRALIADVTAEIADHNAAMDAHAAALDAVSANSKAIETAMAR